MTTIQLNTTTTQTTLGSLATSQSKTLPSPGALASRVVYLLCEDRKLRVGFAGQADTFPVPIAQIYPLQNGVNLANVTVSTSVASVVYIQMQD